LILTTLVYLIRLFLEGTGGPIGYGAQRYFAAKDDEEVAKMSMIWIVLLTFRWPFTVALVLLGHTYNQENFIEDPERVVPIVLSQFTPIVLRG